jgi:protein tyrosine kinase modulator
MLQKTNFETQVPDEDFESYENEVDRSYLLRPGFYWELVKRRWILFVIPVVPILVIGLSIAALWPATYLSEGKILVQSQLIPTELVRPTVTNAAQERIQVIEQRVMTRENLIAIADKFQLFPTQRPLMSPTQLVDAIKKNVKIEPFEDPLAFKRVRSENPTIIFTVGFEYANPQAATQVANELVTRILSEDLRDRTSRATDTTQFLTKEVQRLQAENSAIEAKVAQAKLSQANSANTSADGPAAQLAQLNADYAQKSAFYSDRHPIMQALKRQIAALQKVAGGPSEAATDAQLEALQTQLDNTQKNLENASQKLAAARLGETLERNQQSEKLEVIEQPTTPQEPIKPNRPKIVAMTVLLAVAAGVGLAFLVEMIDQGIRRGSEIYGVVDSRLVVSIPYITTIEELARGRRRIVMLAAASLVMVVGGLSAVYFFMPPLDLVIAKAQVGLFR